MFHHHIFFPFFPGVFGWVVGALFLVPYFLPTIIAIIRGKNNAGVVVPAGVAHAMRVEGNEALPSKQVNVAPVYLP